MPSNTDELCERSKAFITNISIVHNNMVMLRSVKVGVVCLAVFQSSFATAALEGRQRQSIYDSTYKSCLVTSARSAPQTSQSERHTWCACYAGQVVDNVSPSDIKGFSASSGPSPRMTKVANDAVGYCRSKLY